MPIEIECPSGLKGKISKLTGKDARYLSDRSVARAGELVDYVLANKWVEPIDLGPYKFDKDKPIPWGRVLVGDRDFALIRVRVATYGADYEFKIQCPADSCRERFVWEIDLDKLPVQSMSEEDRDQFRNENKFSTSLMIEDDAREFEFKLVTGDDVSRMTRLQREQRKKGKRGPKPNPLVDSLLLRTISVAGVEPKDGARRDFFEGLDLGTLAQLVDAYDEHDCGINTTIEIECPECEARFEVNLPFDEGFFFPTKKKVVTESS